MAASFSKNRSAHRIRYNSREHGRRSIRLPDYDYSSQGFYFVTICSQHRECLFGEIIKDEIYLNKVGVMLDDAWRALPLRFPNIELDAFVVMPNHIHGIIVLPDRAEVPLVGVPETKMPKEGVTPTLGGIVGAYKSLTTTKYIQGVKTRGWPPFSGRLWQRNYYEHIIRNELVLNRIRQYIEENPLRWDSNEKNRFRK